jgi:hypothetical protein
MVLSTTLKEGDRAMAKVNDSATYKNLLLHFIGEPDPLYSMLQWLTSRMMEVESELKVGASKGKHTSESEDAFFGDPSTEIRYPPGYPLSFGSEATPRGICPFFCNGEEAFGAGLDRGCAGGIHQWRIDPEDGTFGAIPGD